MNIIYVSAPWCGPCKMMKPIFNKFVEAQGDKITSEIVNVYPDGSTVLAPK